jgi:hypothetical protein
VKCYLVDEHGIVVLTSSEQTFVIGQPLYKINPWLMLQLEKDGLYDLIVMGNKLQDCSKPPMALNGTLRLLSFISWLFQMAMFVVIESSHLVYWTLVQLIFYKSYIYI